jgi:LCP family protein required for cell wall assembly
VPARGRATARPGSSGGRGGGRPPKRRGRWRSSPIWARLIIILGALTLVGSSSALGGLAWLSSTVNGAVHQTNILDNKSRAVKHATVTGPLNFLLIGSNYRETDPANGERADDIMIVHVTQDLQHAFLVSVPRDLYYDLKATNGDSTHPGWNGGYAKIDAALDFGGLSFMADTITDLTGIKFDGVVESRFGAFETAVNTLGGVYMCVDEETVSVHIGWDRHGKVTAPFTNTGGSPIPVPGVTPMVYHVGCQHLLAWQALDYVRQRELLPNGDYDRQRHHQQFIIAVLKQLTSSGTLSDPVKAAQAAGNIASGMTVDLNGYSMLDLAFGLRAITPTSIIGLKTPSEPKQINGTDYVVGDPGIDDLWAALRSDTLGSFALTHATMVNNLHPSGAA